MRQKDDKKIEQIFKSTLELVEKSGLSGVTMCDISKEAGIATGTLYIYFKNKEELINELFSVCRKQSAGFYFKNLDEKDEFKEAFRTIFFNIIHYRLSHFKESVFLEQYFHSPYVNDKKRQESSRQLQPFFQLLDNGKAQGIIKQGDNLIFLWFMIGSINEVIRGSHYRKRTLSQEDIQLLFAMFWEGMKNHAPN